MKTKVKNLMVTIPVLGLGAVSCGTQEQEQKPNIIMIYIDDMGYADLSCYGETRWQTSAIDSLAEQGMRFTDFYSASALSSPSRAALLTGKYPVRMGVTRVFFPESYTGLPPQETTIAEVLKEEGYATSIVGKWHLGHRHEFLPLQQGFDEYFGIPYSNDMNSPVYFRGNDVVDYEIDQRYITKRYTEEAVDFIERNQDGPFFLYLAHTMTHVPIFVSPEFEGKSGAGIYGDAVLEIDWSIRQVYQAVKRAGIEDNTVILFASDNGPWLHQGPRGGSAGPFKDGKATDYEGGVRVPFIAYWKGHIAPSVNHSVATTLDIFPTLAKLAGADIDESAGLDGFDISQVLFGTGERENQDYVYMANNNKVTGYRSGDWKLSLPYPKVAGNFWKKTSAARDTVLVNLKEDCSETTNLYYMYPEKVKELVDKIHEFEKTMQDLPEPLIVRSNQHMEVHSAARKQDIEDAKAKGVKPQQDVVVDYIVQKPVE